MRKEGLKPATALAAALVLAVLFAACGGNGDSSSSAKATSRLDEPGPLRVSGGGIGQFREPGADNSIEEYGPEGTRAELKQAARAVHKYLVARIEEDWVAVCAYMSKPLRQEFEGKDCPKTMTQISAPPMGKTPYESTEVDAGSILVKGNYGFLFFDAHTNGRKLILFREGGNWKPLGLIPTSLH